MHPFLDYIFKANLLLVFFGLFYYLFLRKETFYQLNRWYFIGSIIFSVTAPLITFTKTVFVEPIPIEYLLNNTENVVINELIEERSIFETIDFQQTAVYLILFISLVLIIKKIYAIFKLYHSIKKLPNFKNSNIKITTENKTVYSFYRWIVVPENFFQWKNHALILNHEKIHLNQKHTFDLILIELVLAVFWFNPLLKIMQRNLNSNLEFIVDQKMIETTESVLYQKNLLQFQTQNNIQFVNSYNASELKNRILQLNSKKSTHMKKLKFLLATPILAAFFIMFQVETIAQVKETENLKKQKTEKIEEHKPLENGEIKKNENIQKNQIPEKDQDFYMLLKAVEKDLEVLKNDRKTFNKIASKFPITVDGILMTKKELKKFDTSKIKSAHIDAGNPEKGNVVNLSTNDDDNSGVRMFTFKLADDSDQYLQNLKEDTKYSVQEVDKPFDKILIDGKESTEEELQNFYQKANSFKAQNLNRILVIESNPENPNTTIKIGSNTLKYIYLLNGKEISGEDFGKIHPNDIERIDVLKDKKVIKKYGDKAKDGVIVVTTKTKKEVSLQQKTQALKARELAIKNRNEAIAERNEIILQNKKEIEKRRKELLKKRNKISEKTQQRRKELEKKQWISDFTNAYNSI